MAHERDPNWQQDADALTFGADLASCLLPPSDPMALPAAASPLRKLRDAAQAMHNAADAAPPVATCQQRLWLSFFFDGTGNNLDADVGTSEHSNVARMYRAHQDDDPALGRYRHYIPGIGTYFPEVEDDGGTMAGQAFAAKGDARLKWAWQRFEQRVQAAEARAMNPTNKIIGIEVAVFGFSRGAALARAFVRDLAARCEPVGAGWQLQSNQAPVSIRFMGLWDTVASVGLPAGAAGAVGLRPRPMGIAFGQPGADPTLGLSHGHGDWGQRLDIPEMVQRCVHHVAAHEIRNSFPLDSVMRDGVKPSNCVEVVYPGAHSNVGGGYRPGEGGRSNSADLMLSQISLKAMYDEALAHGVQLITAASQAWKSENHEDFRIDAELVECFNHYMKHVGPLPLGEAFNAHNRLAYAWRFRRIRAQGLASTDGSQGTGQSAEEQAITVSEEQARRDKRAIDAEIESIEREDGKAMARARGRVLQAERALQEESQMGPGMTGRSREALEGDLQQAKAQLTLAQDRLLRAKARLDTLPSSGVLISSIKRYDADLLTTALDLQRAISVNPLRRHALRPHYKALFDAFEDEFVHGRGMTDPKVIEFFDLYVHDSLAGFAKDGTKASDPRVVYVGGDVKLRHAHLEPAFDYAAQGMAA